MPFDFFNSEKLYNLFYFVFWLFLCPQHFHNDFQLLNKESALDPVKHTFGNVEPPWALLTCLFVLENLIRTLGLVSQHKLLKDGPSTLHRQILVIY